MTRSFTEWLWSWGHWIKLEADVKPLGSTLTKTTVTAWVKEWDIKGIEHFNSVIKAIDDAGFDRVRRDYHHYT